MIDHVDVSRLQFAFTIGFHILWPAYSIGIASFVALLNALWVFTNRPVYKQLLSFWQRLFALGFAMGVVTGVVLSYQIGGNWSEFARETGPVIGPLFTYEVLTAFFLEAGFLGIALLGEQRVGRGWHLFASVMVALGTIFSAFWVLAANSWMQTPAGAIRASNGVFHVIDWWAVVFNPSFPFRFAHMVCACFITGALIVAGVSAVQLLRRGTPEHGTVALSLALWLLLILAPLQIFLGDAHGLNTRRHQPMKLAAIEARWDTARGVPLTLFALPDQSQERNRAALEIPRLGSLILTHQWDGEVRGLKEVAADLRPNVTLLFFAFRIMAGIGFTILLIALAGAWLRWRGRLFHARLYHWMLVWAMPLGWLALLAGWIVTEAGRQPFVVYGFLRTAEAAAPVGVGATLFSLLLFVVAYAALFLGFAWYFVLTVIRGPGDLSTPKPLVNSRLATVPQLISPLPADLRPGGSA